MTWRATSAGPYLCPPAPRARRLPERRGPDLALLIALNVPGVPHFLVAVAEVDRVRVHPCPRKSGVVG